MSKFTILISAAAVAVVGGMALPAFAQEGSGPSLAEIVVYGNDPCPRTTDDEVVICKRRPEAERYRIPPTLRTSGTRQETESWATRAEPLSTVGATGINSCSAVGPGGHTGCLIKEIKNAVGERKQQAEDAIPPQ